MSRSVISLDVIASDLCSDIGDSTLKHKFKFTRHLLAAYRRLNMFLLPGATEVKSIVLPHSNRIALPCDFQYVTKVGVKRQGSNHIAILTLVDGGNSPKMNDTNTCEYLNTIWGGRDLGPQYVFYNVWGLSGLFYGELYGFGRGVWNQGTYTIDPLNGIIELGSNLPVDSEIIVEYVGNGISNGLVVVPMELKECMEFYAKWKFYADSNSRLAETNKHDFEREYNILKRLYNYKSPSQLATAVNKSISPTNY